MNKHIEKFARRERLIIQSTVTKEIQLYNNDDLQRMIGHECTTDSIVEKTSVTCFIVACAIRYMEIHSIQMDNGKLIMMEQLQSIHKKIPYFFPELKEWMLTLLPEESLDKMYERIRTNEYVTNSLKNGIETIGWLYQFFMKDKVKEKSGLKNMSVKKEDLPLVTQLYTPRWIVDYMNQNSLGKLYDDGHPDNQIHLHWSYYFNQPRSIIDSVSVEEITFFDPACGTGHVLLVAFDMLYDMYAEQGYAKKEIPKSILKNNLFGCDIDGLAIQIASFALFMKALEKDPTFQLLDDMNVIEIIDSPSLTEDEWKVFSDEMDSVRLIWNAFQNGKQFGSLIESPNIPYQPLLQFVTQQNDVTTQKIIPVIKQAYMLSQQYHIIVTNPPYHNKYNPELRRFMDRNYPDYKQDLYSAFMYKCLQLIKANGFVSMLTPITWMFIVSHQKLREHILKHATISSFIQLQYSAFEKAIVPVCTFVLQKCQIEADGVFIRLAEKKGDQANYVKEAINTPLVSFRYHVNGRHFLELDGSTIAYWANSRDLVMLKEAETLANYGVCKSGIRTGNDDKFLRLWHEVNIHTMKTDCKNVNDMKEAIWFPIDKGGGFRKYYGNHSYVLQWKNQGKHILESSQNARLRDSSYYFQKSITWSRISSSHIGFRASFQGNLFGDAGPSLFVQDDENYFALLGILNSKITQRFLKIINPTMNYQIRDIELLPIKGIEKKKEIGTLVSELVEIYKEEWDSYESSWNFKKHSFIRYCANNRIEDSFKVYREERLTLYNEVKKREGAINDLLIESYNYEQKIPMEEIKGEIPFRLAEREKDIKHFLSYFIGCVMGRYSLDIEGIVHAGGLFDEKKYPSFIPVQDGLFTISDKQQLLGKLQEFLTVIFGKETLTENIIWIADSLSGFPALRNEEKIYQYFQQQFFKDHCRDYSDTAGRNRRPIYWLIESGSKKGIQTLLYLHRYTPYSINTFLHNHFLPLLKNLRKDARLMEDELDRNIGRKRGRELSLIMKTLTMYKQQIRELENFQDMLENMASKKIHLDLDDGVKANYAKLAPILAAIKE
ncbi:MULTISPECIES: BREX-1 system adenine-specific DNA-methyltransferase PglX [Bacillus]|uniref:BREX-1 system adenine-specific DNA-methyltransferase PglX n=1 Tax=Bacillus TaxID=1386 RepID=UPI00031A9B56|nr:MULTISPECIES: BREX-1 system adenine-specific DNA-methyltransferase PglX [Bacillus]